MMVLAQAIALTLAQYSVGGPTWSVSTADADVEEEEEGEADGLDWARPMPAVWCRPAGVCGTEEVPAPSCGRGKGLTPPVPGEGASPRPCGPCLMSTIT